MIDGMSEICIDCVHQEVCRYDCHRPSEHCNDRAVADDFRPQGEYVDISKLRLMTVEECAGHTIDYAMGWKACIEWIKKGSAENEQL